MDIVGRFQKQFLSFFVFFSFMLGMSYASHLKGHLDIFFPNEIPTINLASVGTFCVAKPNADPTSLKAGIDWACGPGLANCGPIQPGQPCYVANNIVAIASYAYNAYYQANQAKGATCYFSNTAMLTNTDPSTGSCIFPGSTGGGSSPGGGTSSSGAPPSAPGTLPGSSGTAGGPGTPSGGSGTPGGPGTPSGGSGTPGGSGFSPPFQPTDYGSGASGVQCLNLVYLLLLVFLSLLIL